MKTNKKNKLIKKILFFVALDKKLILLSFFFTFIEVISALSGPFFIGKAINAISGTGTVDFNTLFAMTAVIIGVFTLSASSGYFVSYINNVLTQIAIKKMRDNFLQKLQKLPFKYLDGNASGDLISRMTNDIEMIGDGILQGFTQAFSGILTIIGIIGFMIYINLYVALAIIFISPLSVIVAIFITKRTQAFFKRQQNYIGQLSGIAEEMISGQKVVIAYNYRNEAIKKFDETNENLKKTTMVLNFYTSLSNPSARFINNIVYVVAGILGVYLGLSIGSISSFLLYSNKYARPFNDITNIFSQLQNALASAARVFEFLEAEEEITENNNIINPEETAGVIEFKNVNFSYNKDMPLIQNFNLIVKAGKKIAIVGRTGSGKTTLVNLLMRFYDIDSGEISIDGKNIYDVTRKSLRSCFKMVLQDTWLFKSSIKANIAYGKPGATEEEIIEACKLAHCHDFIINMKYGYDTEISEQGGSLSEGQKQLICIARVMLSSSPVLILDEATSNIDTRTEKLIQNAFDYLTAGKTSFVIAHRLSTIIKSDLILVIEGGNIIEKGTHSELLLLGGAYAKLYNSQFAAVVDRV